VIYDCYPRIFRLNYGFLPLLTHAAGIGSKTVFNNHGRFNNSDPLNLLFYQQKRALKLSLFLEYLENNFTCVFFFGSDQGVRVVDVIYDCYPRIFRLNYGFLPLLTHAAGTGSKTVFNNHGRFNNSDP